MYTHLWARTAATKSTERQQTPTRRFRFMKNDRINSRWISSFDITRSLRITIACALIPDTDIRLVELPRRRSQGNEARALISLENRCRIFRRAGTRNSIVNCAPWVSNVSTNMKTDFIQRRNGNFWRLFVVYGDYLLGFEYYKYVDGLRMRKVRVNEEIERVKIQNEDNVNKVNEQIADLCQICKTDVRMDKTRTMYKNI